VTAPHTLTVRRSSIESLSMQGTVSIRLTPAGRTQTTILSHGFLPIFFARPTPYAASNLPLGVATGTIRTLAITGGQEIRRKEHYWFPPELLTSC